MTEKPERHLEIAALSDVGTERGHNEDCWGAFVESETCAIVAVADGVSSSEGGEVASQMAIETMLRAYREEPPTRSSGQRLYNAVQKANIEVYERAYAVPELRGMSTTLTAVALEHGELTAVHVGDSRLYLVRTGTITQLTKDHTLAAERSLAGLFSKELQGDRSALTRSVGRELIVSRDRISRRLVQGDVLILCSDGLYNVLTDAEMMQIVADGDASSACRALIEEANNRGTPDNLTAAVVRMRRPPLVRPHPRGLVGALRRLRGRSAETRAL
jgi:serine/threonine protein phosphatase PrpC